MVWAGAITAGAMGACAGAFMGTAVVRAARQEQPWRGRSHCDACGVGLGFARTIPLVSYAWTGGRCGSCASPIDRIHPAAEAAAAAVAAVPFLLLGPGRAVLVAGLGLLLVWESLVDTTSGRLPDRLTLACLVLAAALALQRGWIVLALGVAAAAISFLTLECLRRLFERAAGAPGLGFGDVKLIGSLAIWLGPAIAWAIVLASCAGLLFVLVRRPASRTIPFGPFIAAAGWTVGLAREAQLWPPHI